MDGTYVGALSDAVICEVFGDTGDLNRRVLCIGAHTLYVYGIDGLTSGGDISKYVVKPLLQDTRGGTMLDLYERALMRTVYNVVAKPCEDLNAALGYLLNGFCLVLFGEKAIAFEDKTPEKRSPSAPDVENTVKGPKDAFTETSRTNTSLLRRHLRSAALHFYETTVGTQSKTNVSLAYIDGVTAPELIERMKRRLSELQTEGLITPSSVEELVTGSRPTAFPLIQYTERTDRFA
ncbi:MAG: spore germination protein [Clostridia bacterium]|nr:spore germination protein [Clostridia bacterium]